MARLWESFSSALALAPEEIQKLEVQSGEGTGDGFWGLG